MAELEFKVRFATTIDVPSIFNLIKALAAYEQLSFQVTGSESDLQQHLFGELPCAEAIVAEVKGRVVGFALFFPNYSTFLTKPGLYLEDLFVLSDYRRLGIGRAMLTYLAELAVKRGAGRLEWSVLDWNQSAIDFYQTLGAEILPDWRICRVSGSSLKELAQ